MEQGACFKFSDEQELFIQTALEGKNILVDACIGSGKTTAIQELCNRMPKEKKVLYLTYNRLLKIDAKEKIKQQNVFVTNYHGFAGRSLFKKKLSANEKDAIEMFNKNISVTDIDYYDTLVIDEYQDIRDEFINLLNLLKERNPKIQIVAVGDMEQKVYDYSRLDVKAFITGYLEDYIPLSFTICFRLSSELAAMLGRIWHKQIIGVNRSCNVLELTEDEVVEFLSAQKPKDILCLGERGKEICNVLNRLETEYNSKFNKNTVYASIYEQDGSNKLYPQSEHAIFTTYDSSKGLERKICILFDYTESYWEGRVSNPGVSYEILRNIFCVGASRGKETIVFVKNLSPRLSEETLARFVPTNQNYKKFDISTMFDFKYPEDVRFCFSLLETKEIIRPDYYEINIASNDGLIDLSPCIGIYQEYIFFNKYALDLELYWASKVICGSIPPNVLSLSAEKKILYLVSKKTGQQRYFNQVSVPYVTKQEKKELETRLSTLFSRDEAVQTECKIRFALDENGETKFEANGNTDVIKDGIVYELKFVSELCTEHFLQCACYMIALNLEEGILWNTRNNKMYSIRIPDRQLFMNSVVNAITKGVHQVYYPGKEIQGEMALMRAIQMIEARRKEKEAPSPDVQTICGQPKEYFAVLDCETTISDKVMSIGVILADASSNKAIRGKYYILTPESTEAAMFSYSLTNRNYDDPFITTRAEAIEDIKLYLDHFKVKHILAYNASFDYSHLPELSGYVWADIMKIAAYKQYNHQLPSDIEFYSTGRMKRNYGVADMIRLLSARKDYIESHNAFSDALDELFLVKLLGYQLPYYEIAIINPESQLIFEYKENVQYSPAHEVFFKPPTSPAKKMASPSSTSVVAEKKAVTSTAQENPEEKVQLSTAIRSETQNNQTIHQTSIMVSDCAPIPIAASVEMEICTTSDAAEILGITVEEVRDLIHANKLMAKKISGRFQIEKSEVYRCIDYVEQQRIIKELQRALDEERINKGSTILMAVLIIFLFFVIAILIKSLF